MTDAVFNFGGTTVAVDVRGAPGPRGLASGPLGAESVTDEEINTAAASDILIKLGGVAYQGAGGIGTDGGVASGLSLGRDDAGMFIVAPTGGTPGQQHALFLFRQPNNDDESAIVGIHVIDGANTQIWTMFSALEDHNDDPDEFVGYTMFHGVSHYGDVIPIGWYYDNRVEVLSGIIDGGNPIFDRGLTDQHVFHNFQNTYLQGWTVMGTHAQSTTSGNVLEVAGPAFFGTVDGSGNSNLGLGMFWHVPSAKAYLQSYAYSTSTYQNMVIAAAALEVSATTIGFHGATPISAPALGAAATDAASTQTLANAMRTAWINYGLATA